VSRNLRHGAAVAIALLAVVALVGTASAYWGGEGDGRTQLRLGDAQALVLGPGVPSALLYPGGDSAVSVVATNANPYTVHVGTIHLDTSTGMGGFDVDAAHSTCDTSSIAFASQSNGGAGWTVPPRAGGTDGIRSIDLPDALSMSTTAADACQGAVFTVHLTIEP